MPESEPDNRFLIGYALPARKLGSFMVPTFINQAKDRGIDFVAIDVSKPLTDQSPFHCIVHKLYTDDWKLNLHDFTVSNPNTVIIDPPSAIERLQNRISMLEFVTELKIPNLSIPNQLLVEDSSSLSSVIATGKLNFPMIAKPVVVDGSAKSHKMSLVLNVEGLTKGLDLESPVVLQQFVNHGGVIFKVYVAGDYVKCVKRRSLPDISEEKLEKMSSESGGVICFSQISNSALAGDDNRSTEDSNEVKMPAPEFISETANCLRLALGLHLFNFDMIRDDKGSGYLVIDINYFPGYEKLPCYETVMTDFFLNLMKSHTVMKKTTVEGGSQ
ncbi:inositol-tetrakisphosphate 1-kinase 1-like [Cynara cardunculus var. scolymus]|uniref:Inositol-tetrakisphosphate 1-kinase n=1 Tax=Cynara cardunculus var. scolymus TaxID=59895 RepID=A0A118JRG7_CYNCS|nr:inositol-tetrakisphosphate 1-kinase 1-like [Cynara cardunculus var. scolymus]KVH87534.1 hypothetical protein Ccrd_025187 [Cynara cardunculus var. scolymus]